jgi:pyruvate/2-oxoglutarate dehydrogenase complex dihydrolipoamide acyltransferase (E2) component
MDAATTFTDRSNAKRAAKRLLDAGRAPAVDFDIQPTEDGRFAIHWDTTAAVETEIAAASAAADSPPAAAETPTETPTQTAEEDPELEAMVTELERRGYRVMPPRRQRRSAAPPRERRPSKDAALDEAAARGVVPDKPVIISPTNQHQQKRLDRLAELAAAGDWPAIEAYPVTGTNTYSQVVRRYRDRLLAAHAAQQLQDRGETLAEGCERYMASCGL